MKRTIDMKRAEAWFERGLRWTFALGLALGVAAQVTDARAQDNVLNLYSARHYQTDEALYSNFTKQTGIKINRLEAKEDQLLQRMKAEGDKSPADVLITVDAGRLWRAQSMGLLQPIKSAVLEKAIPAHLREPDGHWFGFSKRARVIVVNKAKVKPGEIARYEDLANEKWKGRVLIRSSTNVYNQSLVGSMIATLGPEATETWAKAMSRYRTPITSLACSARRSRKIRLLPLNSRWSSRTRTTAALM